MKAHDFVSDGQGKVIYCRLCGAIKFSYFKSKYDLRHDGEIEKANAECKFGREPQ